MITTKDIFEDKKLILDDFDIQRAIKNKKILQEQNIPYLENMKIIPINSICNLVSKEEIWKLLLFNYIVATLSTDILNGDSESNTMFIDLMDEKYNISQMFSQEQIQLIANIFNNKLSNQELRDYSWCYEKCAVYMWALGIFEKPLSNEECNVEKMNEILFFNSEYTDLYKNTVLKSKEEIMEFADLIFRYKWACEEARIQNKMLPELNEMIVMEQKSALESILDWKIEKLIKKSINIRYETDDFDFNFNIPSSLHILGAGNHSDNNFLLALADKNDLEILTFIKLNYPNVNYLEDETKKLKKDNWNIIETSNLSFQNFKDGVTQIIAINQIPNSKNLMNGLIYYYFKLNNNLVCLIVKLGNEINYSNIDNIKNSNNNLLAKEILFSMHENIKSDKKIDIGSNKINPDVNGVNDMINNEYIDEEVISVINNEYDYSNIFPTDKSLTYLIQYFDSIYKQFMTLIEDDEKRNMQFKDEYRKYMYKRSYSNRFEIHIRGKGFNNIVCKDFETFLSAVNDGNLKNISSLEIKMCLDYKRGQGKNLVEHENLFLITFKPYDIKFTRKSNHNEASMNQIENAIKDILNKLPVANCIFCTK